MVGDYALALWESTQDYRIRAFELATYALDDHAPHLPVFAVNRAGDDAIFQAVRFGARVGLQLAQDLAPPRAGDADQAAWLARAYRSAERAWPQLVALSVEDDRMAPALPAGSTVVVATGLAAEPGDLVVAESPYDTVIRELRADGRDKWLVSSVREIGGIPVAARHVGGATAVVGIVVGVAERSPDGRIRSPTDTAG